LSVQAGGQEYAGESFINSMPLNELIRAFRSAAPPEVLACARTSATATS